MPFSLPIVHIASAPGCQGPLAPGSPRIPFFHLSTMWGFWPPSLFTHSFSFLTFLWMVRCAPWDMVPMVVDTENSPLFGGSFGCLQPSTSPLCGWCMHHSSHVSFLAPSLLDMSVPRIPYYNDYTLKSADFTLIHTSPNLVIL